MKRTLTLLLFLPVFYMVSAQTPVSVQYTLPPFGMAKLRLDNPYIRVQRLGGNSWEDEQLLTTFNAPNIDSTGLELTADLQPDNTWKNSQIRKDSFVLDNQGRVTTHIDDEEYIFSSTSYRYKTKYQYTYNNESKISRIRLLYPEPVTSNTYYIVAEVFPVYDMNGRRIYDSTYLNGNGNIVHDYFQYDNAGNLISHISMMGTDTLRTIYLTYSGEHIATSYIMRRDPSSDEWAPYSADTLTYDVQGRMLSHISWSSVFISGNPDPLFARLSNEEYHYTSTGLMDEMISKQSLQNNTWVKTVISHDQTGKPTIAYEYTQTGGVWSTESFKRYLFAIPTGINEQALNISGIGIYPNPCTTTINLDISSFMAIEKTILFDANGKCVYSSMKGEPSIDVSELHNGIYYLNLVTSQGTINRKIVVQH